MTAVECKSDFKLTKYFPYLTLTGELWGVDCEELGDNWRHRTVLTIQNEQERVLKYLRQFSVERGYKMQIPPSL